MNKLNIEVAKTDQERQKGLMNRTSLKPNDGMLFIFDTEQILSFWMKNTLIPLSIAYVNSECVIIDIQDMLPETNQHNLKSYISKKPAKYAIETNIGWFKKNNLNVGAKIKIAAKNINHCK
jgi:uncharacterized membrane protein (UPF0127 family)